jgi:class 3 adenylate cyclase
MNANPPNTSHPTFLFTDIVDSSKMTSAFGHTAYVEKLQQPHDTVLRQAIALYHGYVDGTPGDSFFVAFNQADEALDCARAIQESLHAKPITATDRDGKMHTLAVRIGVHTAESEVWFDPNDGYRGQPDVNFAARVMSLAEGEQVLVSEATYKAASNARACKWQEWPDHWIKSFEAAPQTLYEFLWDNGESRGEPGLRWLPATFRTENDRYIPRPELEAKILSHFKQPKQNSVPARMVTLVGYGGMGKTRLAVACALKAVGVFTQGVYFVPLADRAASAQTLVESIGAAIKEAKFAKLDTLLPQNPSRLDDLLPALRDKFVLLVLDNYESVHCEEAQTFLRELLRETRHLRLLLTSREAAHLHPLEKELEIEGLTPEQATELFIDRAQRTRGRDGWTPDSEQEQQALRDILRLTDRIPLAIELVAAWMGLYSIQKIAAELEKTPCLFCHLVTNIAIPASDTAPCCVLWTTLTICSIDLLRKSTHGAPNCRSLL